LNENLVHSEKKEDSRKKENRIAAPKKEQEGAENLVLAVETAQDVEEKMESGLQRRTHAAHVKKA